MKIKKSTWIYASLTLLVAAYIVAATVYGRRAMSERLCKGVLITVHDTAQMKFVTPLELAAELGRVREKALVTPVEEFNLDSLERMLRSFDKIEKVTVNMLTNDKLHIDVWPMQPVARIFDPFGASYYINREGKRIVADARYFLDVPVVAGDFSAITRPATYVIPLIDFIEADTLWKHMISMVKMDARNDLILVPAIRGHVINIGDTLDLRDKFDRLRRVYTEVLPVKGWNFYDTITVKWRGQVVATRRLKQLPDPVYADDENEEQVDISTMMAGDNIAPGQAVEGQPVKVDEITPGRRAEHQKADSAATHNATPPKTDNNKKTG